MLESKDGDVILRRAGGNPFRDDTLTELVGRSLRIHGSREGSTFIMTDWEEV